VFVEYLSPLKRNRIKAKLLKEERGMAREAELKAAGRRY
jgi:peptide deformylase